MNDQVTAELEAALVYLQLSYILDALSLNGMRDWMKAQHEEELDHAAMFSDHLLARDYTPQIGKIAQPQVEISNAIEAFVAALAHEEKVTGLIRDLMEIAEEEKDYQSRPLIYRFLEEQIEEEATVKGIIDRLKMADSPAALLLIDAELGERNNA